VNNPESGSPFKQLTTMRQPFLRRVGTKKANVKQPQVASMMHCPTLKPPSGVNPAGPCSRVMVLMKAHEIQKEP
jgi:hypothetical protein